MPSTDLQLNAMDATPGDDEVASIAYHAKKRALDW